MVSGGVGGGQVGGFMFYMRFRPFGVDLQKKMFTENVDYQNFCDDVIDPEVKFFSEKKICKSTPNGLKRVKNTKPPTRPPTDFPSRVC